LSVALAMTSPFACAMDSKVLRIIGPDARMIYGMDVDRYRRSALASLYPADLEWLSTRSGVKEIHALIAIISAPDGPPLFVISGAPATAPVDPDDEQFNLVRLDQDTAILGEAGLVKDAANRWKQEDKLRSDVADRAQRLNDAFDLWFLGIRPLDQGLALEKGVLKYRDEFVQVIEEVRGGIRLGATDQMSIEALARTADDAASLAALGRWLPGLIQMQGARDSIDRLLGFVENLRVSAQGRTAVASFAIPDSALEAVAKARRIVE
jgi:hypothetical protein